ncbi:MAG TPA: DUF3300 domain-containing protein [Tepidisphaeraceae bacterium]|nr:DUF3300 domain-containing protein [Tepidisphaeraceae bacterium]
MNGGRWLRKASTYGSLLAVVALIGFSGCVPVVFFGPPAPVYYGPPVYVPPPQPYYAPPPEAEAPPAPESSDTDLQQLVAPIALYPDPILADILPASTFPDQIQAAAQWMQENPSPSDDAIAAQPWDPSVQALVHYPTVLTYMSGEIAWTQSLGSAVTNEQPDVMAAVQDLRAQALAQGNLVNTPQQVVVQEGTTISIQPADPAAIFIPVYDPVAVYARPWAITFGPAYVPGVWLGYGFDWNNHYFYHGDWRGGWVHGPYGWRRDPNWRGPGRWERDGRWGRPPYVRPGHYAFRHEVATHRGEWHHVEARHREEVHSARAHGDLRAADHRSDAGSGAKPGAQEKKKAQPQAKPAEKKKY